MLPYNLGVQGVKGKFSDGTPISAIKLEFGLWNTFIHTDYFNSEIPQVVNFGIEVAHSFVKNEKIKVSIYKNEQGDGNENISVGSGAIGLSYLLSHLNTSVEINEDIYDSSRCCVGKLQVKLITIY